MIVVRTIEELRAARGKLGEVAFVPTMGAFHAGHIELMRQAGAKGSAVAVSLFVNPLQFAPTEDLSKYPRQEERDFSMAESAGVDLMFAPSPEVMVGHQETRIVAGKVAQLWEGAHRPGHFDGVATIVAKLFNMVQPQSAYFGLKDLQQCAVIRELVHDLNFPIELCFCETIREPDGLAMSSRNQYFNAEQRADVVAFPRALVQAVAAVKENPRNVSGAVTGAKRELEAAGFAVDYVAFVDSVTMQATDVVGPDTRIIGAVRKYGVRLIDNHSAA